VQLLAWLDIRAEVQIDIPCASPDALNGRLREAPTRPLTLTDPDDAPALSITFYSTGGPNPAAVAKRLLAN
jgi:hypothetical protein